MELDAADPAHEPPRASLATPVPFADALPPGLDVLGRQAFADNLLAGRTFAAFTGKWRQIDLEEAWGAGVGVSGDIWGKSEWMLHWGKRDAWQPLKGCSGGTVSGADERGPWLCT